ncbi:hypothetical protein AB0K20_27865 [Micromonospora matsumotoense]|uniref:hypothetical protein n=1 Tax=Micromonospora matsumotoense TaxID=121616 RepID=UPI00343BEA92
MLVVASQFVDTDDQILGGDGFELVAGLVAQAVAELVALGAQVADLLPREFQVTRRLAVLGVSPAR